MSYFIIIRGPLGIGKTTISKELSKKLKTKYFSMDSILKEIGLDKASKKEGCIPARNFIKADNHILSDIKKNLDKKQIVILDGCFYHREQIEHIIKKLSKYKHFVFTLKAPVETCIKRDKNRKKSYGKGAAMAVHELVSKFDYGINVNTDGKTLNETTREITSSLSSK